MFSRTWVKAAETFVHLDIHWRNRNGRGCSKPDRYMGQRFVAAVTDFPTFTVLELLAFGAIDGVGAGQQSAVLNFFVPPEKHHVARARETLGAKVRAFYARSPRRVFL